MNAFQIVVVSLLGLLAIITVRSAISGRARKRVTIFWMLVWLTGATATIWPNFTRDVARSLGIGRGTDLVLYCSVLLLVTGLFYVYTRMRHMDRTMTLLVRELAIERARASALGHVQHAADQRGEQEHQPVR
jgi:hypothetical protein